MSRIGGTCARCGLPGHRYGTTDREHKPDATGCINSLRAEIELLRDELATAKGKVREAGEVSDARE